MFRNPPNSTVVPCQGPACQKRLVKCNMQISHRGSTEFSFPTNFLLHWSKYPFLLLPSMSSNLRCRSQKTTLLGHSMTSPCMLQPNWFSATNAWCLHAAPRRLCTLHLFAYGAPQYRHTKTKAFSIRGQTETRVLSELWRLQCFEPTDWLFEIAASAHVCTCRHGESLHDCRLPQLPDEIARA